MEKRMISIVVPVRNEKENVHLLTEQLREIFTASDKSFEIVFIDDGSTDNTFAILTTLHSHYPKIVRVIKLARNFGHQIALTAGFNHANGDAIIAMDADLQDPPTLILSFIEKWDAGCDIVYGRRTAREGESFLKKITASFFYTVIRRITSCNIQADVGDFYLLDRKVVTFINSLPEHHRFLRGLVAWTGFSSTSVNYVRKPRYAGSTKYSWRKTIHFAIDAITAFSFAPLRFILIVGLLFAISGFLALIGIILRALLTEYPTDTIMLLTVIIIFIGGIQLSAIGVIGEYIGRISDDVRARPLYVINKILE